MFTALRSHQICSLHSAYAQFTQPPDRSALSVFHLFDNCIGTSKHFDEV